MERFMLPLRPVYVTQRTTPARAIAQNGVELTDPLIASLTGCFIKNKSEF